MPDWQSIEALLYPDAAPHHQLRVLKEAKDEPLDLNPHVPTGICQPPSQIRT